jgi:hypothetical protein
MGYSIYFDSRRNRDLGYGVPAVCDHPDCENEINRGLSYLCGDQPYTGGEHGCSLYFCGEHKSYHTTVIGGDEHDCDVPNCQLCERCQHGLTEFDMKPDTKKWMQWKLSHESWQQWRDENPQEVEKLVKVINNMGTNQ